MGTIEEIKKKFKNEWVLIEVLEKDNLDRPIKGKVISHSRNRDDTYNAMEKCQAKHLYHFYTGKIPKKGYAVAFDINL